MPKRGVPIKALSITLPAEDVEVLRALAQRLDRPLSYVIEGMLVERISLARQLLGMTGADDNMKNPGESDQRGGFNTTLE